MQTKSFLITVDDGAELWVNRWLPDSDVEIKGVVQLHHGLQEHSMRYDRFGSILAENGYVLNAYDMRGHGHTAQNAEAKKTGKFGKLADKNGFIRVVDDLHFVTEDLKKTFPGKKVILFGHSFGSFVSQAFIEKYGSTIDGCVLCGTSGPMKFKAYAGNFLINLMGLFSGWEHESPFCQKMCFGGYNTRFPDSASSLAWLSKNETNQFMYQQDNWCGTPLMLSFYKEMTYALKTMHRNSRIKNIPVNLPVYFIYGTDDPVGNYGKSIQNLVRIYKKAGIKDISVTEYQDDRHEILNEDDHDQVEADVLAWIKKVIG